MNPTPDVLPPLPDPTERGEQMSDFPPTLYTAEQMREYALAALASLPSQPTFVPIGTNPHDEAGGRHPNDNTPRDEACQAALDERGDASGQGLCSYWKWGFRSGWHASLAALSHPPAEPVAKVVEQEFEYPWRTRIVPFGLSVAQCQERLPVGTLLYTHPPAVEETMTAERIDRIAELVVKGMPDGIRGFSKTWGWQQFARALLDICPPAVEIPAVEPVTPLHRYRELVAWLRAACDDRQQCGDGFINTTDVLKLIDDWRE